MKIIQNIKFAVQLAGSLAVVAVAVLSLVPGSLRPHTGASKTLEHFTAYLLTAGLPAFGYGTSRYPAVIALFLSIYSAALEIAQLRIPGRDAEVLDFLSSSIGAFIGCALAWLVLRTLSRNIA